jgi:FkbM family methyltransferase
MKNNAKVVDQYVHAGRDAMTIEALNRLWAWPAEDTECWPVIFEWSPDITEVLRLMEGRKSEFRSAVQAGGNMGVWPWLLSLTFKNVYTFEPDPRCFPYLVENTNTQRNIFYYQATLGDRRRMTSINHLPGEETNLGAQYVTGGGHIPTLRIDDLMLDDCDLIYLDIEGFELFALRGALSTLAHTKPCIVVEDKGLSNKFGYEKGFIEDWLEREYDYMVVARLHRDVVLMPRQFG